MDRVWQWAWDRYPGRYTWAIFGIAAALNFVVYLFFAMLIVAFERSDRYAAAAGVTVATAVAEAYLSARPGLNPGRLVDRCAAGQPVDRTAALEATYTWSRTTRITATWGHLIAAAAQFAAIAAITGAAGQLVAQYAALGAFISLALSGIAAHSIPESAIRPARLAIAADTRLGEDLPRSHPTFAAWANGIVVAAACAFSAGGAMVAVLAGQVREHPILVVAIAIGLALLFAVPITVATSFSPLLQPIRDLARGTERVAAGDYSQPLPVVQDDDLGALAASFNRMQAGLTERRRLHTAFGTYVDPALAARLLEQGDDVFTGERREVTVMFVDIRDFTPYAEANSAEDTVARLNALFEIVVPSVVEAGGHVNKFLGDGALAVFGAPNDLIPHADAAVGAAVQIARRVAKRFDGELRIGIGLNTGVVIVGTIGGGGKLEFTLIGDAVNVAARVEQITKTTGDTILLTQHCVEVLRSDEFPLEERGSHALKGKALPIKLFGIRVEP